MGALWKFLDDLNVTKSENYHPDLTKDGYNDA